jgi:hypothetical protein
MKITDYDDKNVILKGVKVLKETEKALLVESKETGEEHWMPKSQIHDDSDVFQDEDEGDMIVSKWLANEKNLL